MITLEEHADIAGHLREIDGRLGAILDLIQYRCPGATMDAMVSAAARVEALRQACEAEMFAKLWSDHRATTDVYYLAERNQ